MNSSDRVGNLRDIAVIGMAGRFPGAKDIGEFWRNLKNGTEGVHFFSDEELLAAGISQDFLDSPSYVKAHPKMDGVDLFDAQFFGLSPRESEILDPQHRLFLECAWEAFENAGYCSEKYQGRVGVYAGAGPPAYLLNNVLMSLDVLQSAGLLQAILSNDKDYLPMRVSYKLDLKGPSVNVQSACSTSLVAAHFACESLLNGECDMAIAGASSIKIPQEMGYFCDGGGLFSDDGHCRPFDSKATGTIFGNGVGVVVLKRLEEALEDGDTIHAIIKGSAVNNDGSHKVSFTAPGLEGQAEVISEALSVAEIDPETVGYIEAHGTGTRLGDPIEIAALTQVFGKATTRRQYCAIGSVKSNIGHLDAAAGIAGLIKTIEALKHKEIPASLNYDEPNPEIDFERSPFYVNRELRKWEAKAGEKRRAGVSSFGIGGTNAHVVLEEAPEREASGQGRSYKIVMLSAKTETALERAANNLAEHLRETEEENLSDVVYTLQVGRKRMRHRQVVICRDRDEAIRGLREKRDFREVERNASGVVYMFPGQGVQYVGMGRGLYESELELREEIDRSAEYLKGIMGEDLREVLFPVEEKRAEAEEKLSRTEIAQPAIFILEKAVARLLMRYGIRPEAMIGHSLGEYTAACLSGVFSEEEGLRLVAARGRLMQQMKPGAMLAVGMNEEEIRKLIEGRLDLAAVNTPSQCVVSGEIETVDVFQRQLDEMGVQVQRLNTRIALHSRMIEQILPQFAEELHKVHFQKPKMKYLSTVTGTWIKGEDAISPEYWLRHTMGCVRFHDALTQLEQNLVMVEVGPGTILGGLVKQKDEKREIVFTVRGPKEQRDDQEVLAVAIGKMWLAGIDIEWKKYYAGERRQRLALPTYPFERHRFLIEPHGYLNGNQPAIPKRSGERKPLSDWFYIPFWKPSAIPPIQDLTQRNQSWLVFIDELGVGSEICAYLKRSLQYVTTVIPGETFEKIEEGKYKINLNAKDDYDRLIDELYTLDKAPERVVHLWTLTLGDGIVKDDNHLALGFHSLMYLSQALGNQEITKPVEIVVASTNMQVVDADDDAQPEKAALLGPCKVIPHEYQKITCKVIDFSLTSIGNIDRENIFKQLLAELAADSSDDLIAYRKNRRWTQSFEQVCLNADTVGGLRVRDGGVYLITGGLGGIGLSIADFLASTKRVKLILTGRSAIPAKDEWASWIKTHDNDDTVSRKIRKLNDIEQSGSEVLIVSADVADYRKMRETIMLAQERFGGINGIIHAAGAPGIGLIQLKTSEDMAKVLDPKIKGLQVLMALCEQNQLDFVVLCSSLSSITGGLGQADYRAANAYLDAFAQSVSKNTRTYTVSIDWDAWRDVGMAANIDAPPGFEQWREVAFRNGLSTEEGIEVLKRVLSTDWPQVVISTEDLGDRISMAKQMRAEASMELLTKAQTQRSLHHRPHLPNPYVAPRSEIEQIIANAWQEYLGIESPGVFDNYFDLGGHSLLASQIVNRISHDFNLRLPLKKFFDAPTIAGLATTIEEIQSEQGNLDKIELMALLNNLSDEEVEVELKKRASAQR